MPEYVFALLLLMLLVGVVVDVWAGKTMPRRKLLHAGLVVLAVLVFLTMPQATRHAPAAPEIQEPPYRF